MRDTNGFKPAFTMAEILISLTIIGIIAAITLPALQSNINEKVWNTQRKALYSRMSQSVSLLPSLNGYGISATQELTNNNAAMAFVTEGLSKVIKINNICDSEHLADCGINSNYINMAGEQKNTPKKISEFNNMFTDEYVAPDITYQNPQKDIDTLVVAFETQNGESILVLYNPLCVADLGETDWHYSQPKMCANFIYDLNGTKGPNTVGKDIGFITALYPTDANIVAPVPLSQNAKNGQAMPWQDASAECRKMDEDSRLPNRDELTTFFYNRELLNIPLTGGLWSSTKVDSSTAWFQGLYVGARNVANLNTNYYVRCVKR